MLNAASEESEVDPTISQMEIVKQLNDYYNDKITRFLEPILGSGGMSVAANVQVDFKKRTANQTTYTPVVGDSGILSTEAYDRQSTNGGTLNGQAAGTEANTGTPTYAQATADPLQSSASEKGNNEYLVNQLIEEIQDQGGQIGEITVAVMINKRDLEPDMTEKYREMVAYAAGISVDKVVVTHAEFSTNPGTMASLGLLLQSPDGVMSVITVILVLLLLLAVVLFIRAKSKQRQKEEEEKAREEQLKKQQQAEEEAAARQAAAYQWLTPEQMQAQWQYAQWQQAQWQQAQQTQWQPQESGQEQWEYPQAQQDEEAQYQEYGEEEQAEYLKQEEQEEEVKTPEKEEAPQPSKYAYLREQPKVEEPPEIVVSENRDQGFTRQVKDFASVNPEIVAQLLRTWMKEDPSK